MGYRVKTTIPFPRSDDPYTWSVEFDEDDVAWLSRFQFVRVQHDDGTLEWRNVGFELRRRVEKIDETTGLLPEVEPQVLARFTQHWDSYLEIARRSLEFDWPDAIKETADLRAQGQGRRGLPDEFFEKVGEEHRSLVERHGTRGAVSELARAHGVNRSTASRWLARARELEAGRGG
jgi:hypothetical protein